MKVEKAAIQDTTGKVWSVSRPGRHDAVIALMKHRLAGEQGFVLDDGSFVGRKKAANVALAAGQITGLQHPPNLYTEDLW